MRILATLVLLPLLLTLPLSAQKVALKCATLAPEGSTWMKSLEALNADVYRRTRGRVAFKFFAGGIAGETVGGHIGADIAAVMDICRLPER